MAKHVLSDGAQKALQLWEDNQSWHTQEVTRVDRLRKSYEGVLEPNTQASRWTSKLHPPYVNHIVETTLAGLVDDRIRFRVRPAARMYDPGEYQLAAQGAEAHEMLMRYQMKADRFNTILRPLALQSAIAGYSVAKTTWRTDRRIRKRLTLQLNGEGFRMVPEQYESSCYDGPTTEVVDVRDWGIHESATDVQSAHMVWHRVWLTIEDLKARQQAGTFKNVSELEGAQREDETQASDRQRRHRDMIEVLEIWYRTKGGLRVVTLGDRRVELVADRPNPFWHGRYPFVVMATQPGLFQIGGVSQVEKIEHLQRALWSLTNQTIDGVTLANNPVVKIRSDVDDPDAYEFEPGARWLVEDPTQVAFEALDPRVGQVAMPHMQRFEQQMQNLAGSQPFTTTSEGRDQANTATEASLVTNLATRSLSVQKAQVFRALEEIGQQRMELNQQFIRVPVLVEQIGLDSQQELTEIGPLLLQGEYLFDIEAMNESLFRQERKAEAQAMVQMMLQYAPVNAALSQSGAAKAMNYDAFIEDWLEANDVGETDRYFSARKQPPIQAPPQQGAGGPPGPGGVTGPQASDESSPSNQSSLSPEVFMQRLMAARGGEQNIG